MCLSGAQRQTEEGIKQMMISLTLSLKTMYSLITDLASLSISRGCQKTILQIAKVTHPQKVRKTVQANGID